MKYFHCFVILLLTTSVVKGKTIVQILLVRDCDENAMNNIVHFENVSWGMISPEISEFNLTLVLLKDINLVTATISGSKCRDTNGHDCEQFMTVPIPKACPRLMDKGQFYSFFTENMTPKWKCPARKGSYHVRRARIEYGFLERMAETNVNYQLKVEMFEQNKRLGCSTYMARFVQLKSRKRKTSR